MPLGLQPFEGVDESRQDARGNNSHVADAIVQGMLPRGRPDSAGVCHRVGQLTARFFSTVLKPNEGSSFCGEGTQWARYRYLHGSGGLDQCSICLLRAPLPRSTWATVRLQVIHTQLAVRRGPCALAFAGRQDAWPGARSNTVVLLGPARTPWSSWHSASKTFCGAPRYCVW